MLRLRRYTDPSDCRLMVLDRWAEMVGAPRGREFFEACDRIDPEIDAQHRKIAQQWVASVLGQQTCAEVFLLALDGLLADQPRTKMLEQRTRLLATHFAPDAKVKRR